MSSSGTSTAPSPGGAVYGQGAVRDALKAVAPGEEIALEVLRAALSRGFPWHSPEVVVPPRSSEHWWAALRPVFLDAYEAVGVPFDVAGRAADQVAGSSTVLQAAEQIRSSSLR